MRIDESCSGLAVQLTLGGGRLPGKGQAAMHNKSLSSILLILSIVLMGACTTQTRLEPSPLVLTNEQHTAIERLNGVRVTANADAWPGLPDVVNQVTPIRITITNNRRAALRIRYSYLSLVGRSGRRYAALPPYRIEGSAGRPVIPEHYGVFPSPSSRYTGFRFAPPYRTIYPEMPDAPRTFYYDNYYYDEHYRYWDTVALPTQEMLDEALVEGDIDPGGHASGFVYFERIGDEEAVSLEVKLVEAADEASVGTLSILFRVRS